MGGYLKVDIHWDKVEIELAIKEKREQMIQSARAYGFTNEITLRHSQELDLLLYEYQRFFRYPGAKNVSFSQRLKKAFRQRPVSSYA